MSSTSKAEPEIIRVGSRTSELALIQTKHVIARLQKIVPNQKFEIHSMTTKGDRILNKSLPKIGEKSLFTKDLEDALHNGRIDFVVHSLKDLPTCLPDGMTIGAILEREDPRDALILNKKFSGKCLKTLPVGSKIGTSSLRRTSQVYRRYPHLVVQDIRGNLNTRLAKLDAATSEYAGIILAQAGIVRMGWHDRISQTLEPDDLLYAVGQGALAVECREKDEKILSMLSKLCCLNTQCRILAERSFLKTLGGGCSAPVAVETVLNKITSDDDFANNNFELKINGGVWSLNGKTEIVGAEKCTLNLLGSNKRAAEDAIQNENIVKKKPRLSTDDDKNEREFSPPKIVKQLSLVDETNTTSNDLAQLIHIHEDAFKKCPYSSVLSNALSICPTTNETSATLPALGPVGINDKQQLAPLKCPLHLSIGEDVMGQCPYFNTSDATSLNILGCGLDKNTNEHINDGSNGSNGATVADKKLACPFRSDVVTSADVKKCPFSNKTGQDNKCNEPEHGDLIKASKCPYLGAAIESGSKTNVPNSNEFLGKTSETISNSFCGLYRHTCYPLNIFETCEAIGRNLANQLIANGAHEVMREAQNEIHQSI